MPSTLNGKIPWIAGWAFSIAAAVFITYLSTVASNAATHQRFENHISGPQSGLVHEPPEVKEARAKRIVNDRLELVLHRLDKIDAELQNIRREMAEAHR